ncbi:MAG: hypothetical protein AAGG44_07685 [Planctomycetota bacterium]
MQELLFESPWTVGIIGGSIVLPAGIIWTQVNDRPVQKIALITMLSTLLLTVALVMVSVMVKTDRESIREDLYQLAAFLESNDLDAIYRRIHPNASEGVLRAKSELPRYTFSEARVTRVKSIQINETQSPRTALAELNVVVEASGSMGSGRVPRFVHVYFMKDGEQWMVHDYEHFDVATGFRNATGP